MTTIGMAIRFDRPGLTRCVCVCEEKVCERAQRASEKKTLRDSVCICERGKVSKGRRERECVQAKARDSETERERDRESLSKGESESQRKREKTLEVTPRHAC